MIAEGVKSDGFVREGFSLIQARTQFAVQRNQRVQTSDLLFHIAQIMQRLTYAASRGRLSVSVADRFLRDEGAIEIIPGPSEFRQINVKPSQTQEHRRF